ncbi:MAG TPA: hypothetical protein VH083_23955, partial [Myxococcales bacterium]|nr:hypothetical protein [Myxococcales bacterium]
MAEDMDGQFDDTRDGSAKRWIAEFKAARNALESWHTSAEECVARYLDDVPRDGQRLNLYPAGIDLKEATLYGNTPSVDVSRRDNDQDDDDARVAAELLKRLLNGDLERTEEAFPNAIGLALKDWLTPGLGNIWLRLERVTKPTPAQEAKTDPATGAELAPAVPASTEVVSEEVASDYVYWKDQLWSPCRVFGECRWWGRMALLSKASIEKKFGKEEDVPLAMGADPKDPKVPKTPWARAEVWEIWDKENSCVWWYVHGHPRVLVPVGVDANENGSVPDPLGISGFWPFPEPLVEGNTTSKLVPRPSYTRAQDLYAGIDDTYTRERLLRDAIDASGVYDKTVAELGQL